MAEQVEKLADGPVPEPVPRTNAGRFRPGDPRINREGRPRGRKAASASGDAPDLAPCADRLRRLLIPAWELAFRLSHPKAHWLVNLPKDAEIVSCRLDAARSVVVLTLRSQEFSRIARGALIPEFVPAWNGRMWLRR
jgi:hypothetical protein